MRPNSSPSTKLFRVLPILLFAGLILTVTFHARSEPHPLKLNAPQKKQRPEAVAVNWTVAASMNTARSNHTATLLGNGKVLVTGGFGATSNYLNSCELYDPIANTWTNTGSLTTGRVWHTATLLPTGKVLVAGGFNGGQPINGAELYDPNTGTWSNGASLTVGRYQHIATSLANGKVLVAG